MSIAELRLTRRHLTSLVPGVAGGAQVYLWSEDSGAALAFTGGTYTLYGPDGTTAATVSLGSGTGEVTAAFTPSGSLSAGIYRERWAVTVSGTIARADFSAIVAPIFYFPRWSTDDVEARCSELAGAYDSAAATWERQIDMAWLEVMGIVLRGGRATQAWTTDHLAAPHLDLAVSYCYDAMGERYADRAARWRQRAMDALGSAIAQLDTDGDGDRDDAKVAVSGDALGGWPPVHPALRGA